MSETEALLTQIIGPMPAVGTSPMLGLALLAALGLLARFPGVQDSTHPVAESLRGNALVEEAGRYSSATLLIALLLLALVGFVANSGKVQGLLGKFVRMGEDTVGAVLFSALAISAMQSLPVAPPLAFRQLSIVPGGPWAIGLCVFVAMSAIVTTRFALDVMVWLIPIPFVDLLFETAKKMFTFGLLALYVFAPAVAFVFSILTLLACLLLVRWAQRQLRFAFAIPFRSILSRFLRDEAPPIVSEDSLFGIGPATCTIFLRAGALQLRGTPARQMGALVSRDGTATFVYVRGWKRRVTEVPLSKREERLVLSRRLAWVELRVLDPHGHTRARVALPSSIEPAIPRLATLLGAADEGHGGVARLFAQPPAVNRVAQNR